MRLEDKVAIVTGTGPNIGGGLAAGLAGEGAVVACNDIRPDAADEAVERIEKEGGEAIAIPGDVTDEEFVPKAVEAVIARWGKVDILINSAVMFNQKGVLTMPVDEYRKQIDVILTGPFLFTKHVAQSMVERGIAGSIINVLSTAAWQGQPGNIGYCTGKMGLYNFTRSAAMELAEYGIRVNGFTPTVTMPGTPEDMERMMKAMRAAQEAQTASGATPATDQRQYTMDFQNLIPLGRIPSPADYVPAIVYLASDESAMLTGSNITIDGGALARYWPWITRTPEDHTYA